MRQWLAALGVRTLYIEPGSPWENGYCESFNSKLRDEFLNGEIFYSLKEAQILTERWRVHYNTVRPHSSLGYRPPAPMAYSLAIPQPSASRSPASPVMQTLIPTGTKHRAGHGYSPAEKYVRRGHDAARVHHASMRPRVFPAENRKRLGTAPRSTSCFNEAAGIPRGKPKPRRHRTRSTSWLQ